MAGKIHELRAEIARLVTEANDALDAANALAAKEERELNEAEQAAQADFDAKIKAAKSAYDLEATKNERLAALAGAAGGGPATLEITDVRLRSEDDPRKGFRSHREFLVAAMENSGLRSRADVDDERLQPLAVTDESAKGRSAGELAFMLPLAFTPKGLNAAAGSDEQGGYDDRYGGFAVPRSMAPGMLQLGAEADPTAGRTQQVPMDTPSLDILARTDKNHNTSVSGGLVVTRRPETESITSSRMEMEKVTLKAASLFGLGYTTEEILVDSPISFAALLESGFRSQFAFHMLNEKLRGNGAGEYLGAFNSPAKVAVAAEGGQSSDTIEALNVIKMRARCWGYGDAIWIANHDCFPQLVQMAIVIEGSAGGGLVLVYKQSMVEDRPDTLLGRPIFYSEHASTIGDEGDISLVNWSQFLEGQYQPLQSAESVHVRFENHERTFKFWLRNAGAPWWRSPLTPHKGASTLSPIVTLAAR